MFLSHTGTIELLPALPVNWPEGKVSGLRARGNLTVDIEWKDGKVTTCRIVSPVPRQVRVSVNGITRSLETSAGP
jgi:alpha-L-fucosidase 2